MSYRIRLTQSQHTLMGNALALAADRYRDYAKELGAIADDLQAKIDDGTLARDRAASGVITTHRRLAEQFERQERETREIMELVDEAEEI